MWEKWIMYTLLLHSLGGTDGDLHGTRLRRGRSWSSALSLLLEPASAVPSPAAAPLQEMSHLRSLRPSLAPLLCISPSAELTSRVQRSMMFPTLHA